MSQTACYKLLALSVGQCRIDAQLGLHTLQALTQLDPVQVLGQQPMLSYIPTS